MPKKIKIKTVDAPTTTPVFDLEAFRTEEERLKADIRWKLQTNASMEWPLISVQFLIRKRYKEKDDLFRKYM